MRIQYTKDPGKDDLEIHIIYPEVTKELESLKRLLEYTSLKLYGSENGRKYQINVSDIYYIETVDRKTFIYTRENVYRLDLKLYKFLEQLPKEEFVQVSKSCILNIYYLKSIETKLNSKLEATLENGEKIWISRTYIPAIKKMLVSEVPV